MAGGALPPMIPSEAISTSNLKPGPRMKMGRVMIVVINHDPDSVDDGDGRHFRTA